MTIEPASLSLEHRLDVVHDTTARISTLVHWLTLPEHVRTVLAEAFGLFSDADLAIRIGKDAAMIAKWRQQAEMLAHVFDLIKTHKNNPAAGTMTANRDLVDAVMSLNEGASSSIIAKALGHAISEPTIRRWARIRSGMIEKRFFVKPGEESADSSMAQDPDQTAAAADTTIEDLPKGIGETPEGKKLAAMIMRHQGKRRWKYSTAERKLIVSLADTFGAKLVHEGFAIAYDTIARLKRDLSDTHDTKPRVPLKYLPVLDLMNKHPGMGPMQVRDYIRRHMGQNMGVNSIRRIMEQNGWVPPYARRSRIKDSTRHFEAVRKNFLWHTDFKHHYINQCRVAILFFQDDYSRFLVGHSFSDSENIETVTQTLEDAIAIHGKPESIMSDGGSAFYSWRGVSQFTASLEDHGIDHYIAKSANVNGKIESVCCQVEKELLNVQTFSSLTQFQQALAEWVGFYNFKRPHQGIGEAHVPADRFYPGAAHWYNVASETTKQQSLVAETMMTLLSELQKGRK